jgi:hypothetical protein
LRILYIYTVGEAEEEGRRKKKEEEAIAMN